MTAFISNTNHISFESLGLNDDIVRGIRDVGFEAPCAILPQVLQNFQQNPKRDLLVINRNGSGKTSAFAICTNNKIDPLMEACQAIILTRTRESAYHIDEHFSKIGKHRQIKTVNLRTGVSRSETLRQLRDGCPHIVIGTPGVTNDYISRKYLDVSNLRNVIFDDISLFSHFTVEFIEEILRSIPESTQRSILAWSVNTFINERQILSDVLRNPIKIIPKYTDERTLNLVEQYGINLENDCSNESKLAVLLDLFEKFDSLHQLCIYCKDRDTVEWLTAGMQCVRPSRWVARHNPALAGAEMHSIQVSAIYPEMDDNERHAMQRSLRNCELRCLVTTCMGGISGKCSHLGLDINKMPLAIVFDLPTSAEEYLLLLGRAVRFGGPSQAIILASGSQMGLLKEVEELYETRILELPDNPEFF
jgi:superfamily II DNA/RNA helicase